MKVHLAGELIASVQRCTLCGEILSDYRNIEVPDSLREFRGFPAGEAIGVGKGFKSVLTGETPTCMAN